MSALPAKDSLAWLALTWLAVWRLTALLAYEVGPFALCVHLRKLLARGGLGRLVTCFHCSSLWVSVGLVSALFEWTWRTPVAILAVAGAASITERWLGGAGLEENEA